MAWVKEFRSIRDKMPECDYLNSVGVRGIFGDPVPDYSSDMVLDRERNFYFLFIGYQGLAYNDEEIYWYMLVLDGKKIELEVINGRCNDKTGKYLEYHWNIRKINILDEDIKELYNKQEIFQIIKEAFTAESTVSKGSSKKLGVVEINISCDMETE